MLRDDIELFRLIASGDEHAFRQIFESYKHRLVSYLTAFTKSSEEAKELTQEVFLSLWVNRAKLSDAESPRNYLFTIARNKAFDFLRKVSADDKMREMLRSRIIESGTAVEENDYPTERSRRLQEAMSRLSRQRLAVFQLSRVEGLTHDQIAARLSISKNTVKNHIIASVKFIKDYIAHN